MFLNNIFFVINAFGNKLSYFNPHFANTNYRIKISLFWSCYLQNKLSDALVYQLYLFATDIGGCSSSMYVCM